MSDDFAWMRRVESPELQDYLVAENDWTAERTAHLADLRQTIFDELAGVLPEETSRLRGATGPSTTGSGGGPASNTACTSARQ